MRVHPNSRGRLFLSYKIWLVALLALAAVLNVTIAAVAQDSTPRPVTDDQVNAVARGLYCPVCENIPLDVCGTQACVQWRELIREKLTQGWTGAQIKQYFVDQYGDRVLITLRPVTDDQVNAVARGLYCPVCENIPLDVCGTQACAQWRDLIRLKLAQGWTDGQIKQYFVDQYGDRVLATPPARGLNWLVYIIPPVAILAGVYILYRAFQAWSKPVPAVPPEGSAPGEPATLDNKYIAQIEEELKKR